MVTVLYGAILVAVYGFISLLADQDVITEPDGNTYLVVTNILEDAQYLNGPYVRTVQFKKENGTAGWNPTPCTTP